MNNFYQNKNILIIGASFGIGEELYNQFDQIGANLCICARNLEKINDLVKNKNHLAVALDVTKQDEFDQVIRVLKDRWQKIDLIIFCAGIYSPMNLDNFNPELARLIFETNFTGFFNLITKILPQIKDNKISHIAVISSVAGYFGMPNSLLYGASKAGLSNLVESLYFELKKYQTKITLINPGFVKTRLTNQNNFSMPFITTTKKIASHIIKQLPKDKFEIYFPRSFAIIMKLLNLMPFALRNMIF